MGTVAENKSYYADYDWTYGGLEWSSPWGNTRAMWRTSLAPRLSRFLPAARVVEIGAGCGRIARLLRRHTSEQLVLIDIMENCVSACRKTFAHDRQVVCEQNDGVSLSVLDDESVDLVVSFYSLVGADAATLSHYVDEFARVLAPDGVAFVHHSNAASYFDPKSAVTDPRMQLLAAYRDTTMSAREMYRIAQCCDLVCVEQECINWDIDEALTDCFSTIVRPGSRWDSKPRISCNPGFREEMKLASRRRSRLLRSARIRKHHDQR